MNKDNKVFANKVDKKIDNNETVFSTLNKKNIKEVSTRKIDNRNINQKINDIFNSRNYIYKADVIIYTQNETLRKRIIGKNSNYLITSTNELIPISDIKDIEYQ